MDSWVIDTVLTELQSTKSPQQPSVIHGSFMQIMVNPMQLQDHKFTAWLDRLVEQEKTGKKNTSILTECIVNPTINRHKGGKMEQTATEEQAQTCA